MSVLFRFCAAILLLLCLALPASAQVTGASVSPASRNVSLSGGGVPVTVTWRINRALTGAPYTLQSQPGIFRLNGNAATWATTVAISRVQNVDTASVTLTETVVVPAAVMRRALQAGSARFEYFRVFTDDNFVNTAGATLSLFISGGVGPVSVTGVDVSFQDGSGSATVAAGAPLSAIATLDVSGSGRLEAVWEVDDSGTGGFFRTISTVSQSVAGQREIRLESPPLPTQSAGRREVRLRVLTPVVNFPAPSIRYFVTGGSRESNRLPGIALDAPASGALLAPGAHFSWQAVAGAASYKIEILSADEQESFITGILTEGSTATGTLSPFVFSQLANDSSYRWRVVALDENGNPLAVSAPRLLRTAP